MSSVKKKHNSSKEKGNISPERALAQAKVHLLKSTKLVRTFSDIRAEVPSNTFPGLLAWVSENPKLRKVFEPTKFPQTLDQLKRFPGPAEISTKNEFKWAFFYMEPHLERIHEFVKLKNTLDELFLTSKDAECLDCLDHIQNTFGFSLWLIKKKIGLLQYIKGLEEQKEFTQTVKDADLPSYVIPFVAHYASHRSEPTASPFRFLNKYHSELQDLDLPHQFIAYLRRHITDSSTPNLKEIGSIMRFEWMSSIVDCYESFVAATKMLVAYSHSELFPTIIPILEKIQSKVIDQRISRLLFFMEDRVDTSIVLTPDQLKEFNSIFTGKNVQCLPKNGGYSVDLDPHSIFLTALAALNASDENGNYPAQTRISEIVGLLSSVLSGDTRRDEAKAALMRFAWAMEGNPQAALVRTVLQNEEPFSNQTPASILYETLGLSSLTPIELWWILHSSYRQKLLSHFRERADVRLPWIDLEEDKQLQNISFDQGDALVAIVKNSFFFSWRESISHFRSENFEEALSTANGFENAPNPFISRNAVRIIAHCLSQIADIEECIDYIAITAINRPSVIELLPIVSTYESLDKEKRVALVKNLSCVILTAIYANLMGSHSLHIISYAAEDFLSANYVKRPSELKNNASEFQKELLVYFLAEVCNEQFMDSWIEYKSSHDVARERVAICQFLIELDSQNIEKYQAEIRDIMRRITLSKRLREVEQSKIYVDIRSLRSEARHSLEESFNRYISFVKHGMTNEERIRNQTVRSKVAQGEVEALLSSAFPRNEMTFLFEKMIVHLRDEFVSSNQHGLDGYLSVRIRHGTLSGQLRGPLEGEHLVTLKDSLTNTYNKNIYWAEKIQLSEEVQEKFQQALSEFADKFDTFVEHIKTNWIQVKRIPTGIGLIDFSLLLPEVDYLSTLVHSEMEFDEFLNGVFTYYFSQKLEPSLDRIRNEFQSSAKTKINSYLSELQTQAELYVPSDQVWLIRTAIGRARTQVQTAIDRIIEWFRLSKTELVHDPLTIGEIIGISTASVQSASPDFEARLSISDDLVELPIVANLPSFVDLFFLIFENTVRHSHLGTNAIARVSVSLENERLCIISENDLGYKPKYEDESKIKIISERVQTEVFPQFIKKEGGTGFFKMKKILMHDFQHSANKSLPLLKFGYCSGDKFFVRIEIPIRIQEDTSKRSYCL